VRIRAVHDDRFVYALIEWPDSTRSQKHLPLVKTARGWRVKQNEYDIQDEDDYYEDKLGVMLSRSPLAAGAGSAHMGPRPLADRPAPAGGRGLHYTADGSILDVWHWKSVRTGSSAMGQVDDNYFGGPKAPGKPGDRYTGGYSQDPHTGGGFRQNWERFDADLVTPLRLPQDPAILARLGRVNMDPRASDDGDFYLLMEETVPYSTELDIFPVGTVLPSVLVEGPFAGDRGDVQARGLWRDGWWHLELRRALDTGSPKDVPLSQEQPTFLWVSVFDHAQTRHSWHLRPLEVVLK
jgi:hypothetical protein